MSFLNYIIGYDCHYEELGVSSLIQINNHIEPYKKVGDISRLVGCECSISTDILLAQLVQPNSKKQQMVLT